MTDSELVKKIVQEGKNWNTKAVAQLYQKYYERILFFISKQIGNIESRDEVAEDICQETLITVIENIKLNKIKMPEKIGSYIQNTSQNKIRNYYNRPFKTVNTNTTDSTLVNGNNPLEKIIDQEIITEAKKDFKKKKLIIEECIKELTQRMKNIIIMTYYEEKQTTEIARELGMNKNNVRQRKHYTLKLIKNCFERKVRNENIKFHTKY